MFFLTFQANLGRYRFRRRNRIYINFWYKGASKSRKTICCSACLVYSFTWKCWTTKCKKQYLIYISEFSKTKGTTKNYLLPPYRNPAGKGHTQILRLTNFSTTGRVARWSSNEYHDSRNKLGGQLFGPYMPWNKSSSTWSLTTWFPSFPYIWQLFYISLRVSRFQRELYSEVLAYFWFQW